MTGYINVCMGIYGLSLRFVMTVWIMIIKGVLWIKLCAVDYTIYQRSCQILPLKNGDFLVLTNHCLSVETSKCQQSIIDNVLFLNIDNNKWISLWAHDRLDTTVMRKIKENEPQYMHICTKDVSLPLQFINHDLAWLPQFNIKHIIDWPLYTIKDCL